MLLWPFSSPGSDVALASLPRLPTPLIPVPLVALDPDSCVARDRTESESESILLANSLTCTDLRLKSVDLLASRSVSSLTEVSIATLTRFKWSMSAAS